MIRSLSVLTAFALTASAVAQSMNGSDTDPMVKLRALETETSPDSMRSNSRSHCSTLPEASSRHSTFQCLQGNKVIDFIM